MALYGILSGSVNGQNPPAINKSLSQFVFDGQSDITFSPVIPITGQFNVITSIPIDRQILFIKDFSVYKIPTIGFTDGLRLQYRNTLILGMSPPGQAILLGFAFGRESFNNFQLNSLNDIHNKLDTIYWLTNDQINYPIRIKHKIGYKPVYLSVILISTFFSFSTDITKFYNQVNADYVNYRGVGANLLDFTTYFLLTMNFE